MDPRCFEKLRRGNVYLDPPVVSGGFWVVQKPPVGGYWYTVVGVQYPTVLFFFNSEAVTV